MPEWLLLPLMGSVFLQSWPMKCRHGHAATSIRVDQIRHHRARSRIGSATGPFPVDGAGEKGELAGKKGIRATCYDRHLVQPQSSCTVTAGRFAPPSRQEAGD